MGFSLGFASGGGNEPDILCSRSVAHEQESASVGRPVKNRGDGGVLDQRSFSASVGGKQKNVMLFIGLFFLRNVVGEIFPVRREDKSPRSWVCGQSLKMRFYDLDRTIFDGHQSDLNLLSGMRTCPSVKACHNIPAVGRPVKRPDIVIFFFNFIEETRGCIFYIQEAQLKELFLVVPLIDDPPAVRCPLRKQRELP